MLTAEAEVLLVVFFHVILSSSLLILSDLVSEVVMVIAQSSYDNSTLIRLSGLNCLTE